MKKWSDIKQATLDKLFLEETEAQQQGYLAKFQYLANECLAMIANGVKPRIATYDVTIHNDYEEVVMPSDFLSFYVNGEPNPDIYYLTNRSFTGPAGDYKIYYNALWQEITKDTITKDVVLDIDPSVLNCLPTYMAAQLLSQDDVQRSAILKNEFELLLSRLDTDVLLASGHFKSEGGWY